MTETHANTHEGPSSFSQLVVMIATSALQQLGQVPDPSGQQSPVSLAGAQGMIDILEMLNAKTKGNLDGQEQKMLTESLTMLRFQYVEVAQAKGKPPADSQPQRTGSATPPPEPGAAAGKQTEQPPLETAGSEETSGESKTRFRKSYG